MRSLRLALRSARELGLYPVALYALYEVQRRVGWLRLKTPIRTWDARSFNKLVRGEVPIDPGLYHEYRRSEDLSFFFDPEEDLSASLHDILKGNEETLLKEANEILSGHFRLFGGPARELGFPPNWKKPTPFLGHRAETDAMPDIHWTDFRTDDLSSDIKILWEPARFSWAYTLGRAFRLSGDPKYAHGLWQLLVSWRDENPPNQGPHWISAQEAALRLMALTFSLYAFYPYLAEEPGRIITLIEIIAAHAERIPPTLLYSRAQGNNHLIVEAVGLYTAGLIFPELKQADRWRSLGRHWLIEALTMQVFPDGGYVQHSTNYHRLALQAALWAIRLGQLNGESFPERIVSGLQKASTCLGSLVNPATGRIPNFGSNDGALMLPLATCSFHDYRPTLQLAHCALLNERPFPAGPWDEACLWFGLGEDETNRMWKKERTFQEISGSSAFEEGESASSPPFFPEGHEGIFGLKQAFPQAGLYVLRGEETWGMFRCAHFTNRPGHSDQLHLDLWWRGENIARDAGTYLYNGKSPWKNGLATAKVHNTIVVDEKEPMWQASRFLWLHWAQGKLIRYERSDSGILEFISGEHDGYDRMGLRVLRSVIRAGDELWMVVDDVIGSGQHVLRSGWLLPDTRPKIHENALSLEGIEGSYEVKFFSPGITWGLYRSGQLIDGENLIDDAEILGWYSPTYAIKEPGLYFAASMEGTLPLRMVSLWSLGKADAGALKVEWEDPSRKFPNITRIVYGREVLDL